MSVDAKIHAVFRVVVTHTCYSCGKTESSENILDHLTLDLASQINARLPAGWEHINDDNDNPDYCPECYAMVSVEWERDALVSNGICPEPECEGFKKDPSAPTDEYRRFVREHGRCRVCAEKAA